MRTRNMIRSATLNRTAVAIAAAAFLALLPACNSDSQGIPMHNTVTLDEANQQTDHYLHSIPSALSRSAALDEKSEDALHQEDMACTDESSEYDQSYRFAQRSYPVTGVDAHHLYSLFNAFHKWAETNDFIVDSSNEHHQNNPVSRATNKAGYRVKLDVEYGRLFLGVSSPCVWRNGKPPQT